MPLISTPAYQHINTLKNIMDKKEILYTEKTKCQDCYKCVKECPVKAVKIEDISASVLYERCVYCGTCVKVCPLGAKKMRDDLSSILFDLESGAKMIVSLAPSYISELNGVSEAQLVAAFKEAGFFGVSETALGAERVAADTKLWLNDKEDGVYIASCCTSAVQYIGKYYPHLLRHLAPIDSPMIAHGKMLKKQYGNETKVVFVGPCVAKKKESDEQKEVIDYTITFHELTLLFEQLGIDFSFTQPKETDAFIPHRAGKGNLFPMDGGMWANMLTTPGKETAFMTFSGETNLREVLNDYDTLHKNGRLFLELMFCAGGCIKGPGTLKNKSVATKRIQTIKGQSETLGTDPAKTLALFAGVDTSRRFDAIKAVPLIEHSETEITGALRSLSKLTKKDELNCSGCGYASCRDFAQALLEGRVEREMCVSFMRITAQERTNVLLQRIPYGVVVVDENMNVVDANEKFAQLLGEEAVFLYEVSPGLHKANITKLVPFHKMFKGVLDSGEDIIDQDYRGEDAYLNISVVSVQKNRLVLGLVQNMKEGKIQNDLVINRTNEVIRENMKVVQKIAYLLGENAAYTESMLNSIVESHSS